MSTFNINCAHCGKNLGVSLAGNPVLEFDQSGAAIITDKYQRFYCKDCNRSTVIGLKGKEWQILAVSPPFLIIPHYCVVHQFSYFDPVGVCPFCELGEEKDG